jgi:nicotinamide-nucleotide amidase
MQSLTTILDTVRKKLVANCDTLGVAESVTSGNLQAACSLAKEATEFFQGGLTLYNTGQKSRHLHIDPIAAERTNCVSEKIAQSMATGACRFFSSDWGIGITGYAAPVPPLKINNTLFAWYAIAHGDAIVISEKIETSKMAMDKVQHFYVRIVLKRFADYLADLYK